MNTTSTNQGGTGRSWLDAIEEGVNRAADALLDGVEKLNSRVDALARSLARHIFPRRR